MPLRYKKLIWIFTLAIMLLGLGTFSLLATEISFAFSSRGNKDTAADKALEGKSKKEIEKEINELIQGYFATKLGVDMEKLGDYVSDVSHIDEKKLVTEAAYIEAYDNISCTIMKGSEKASYRVDAKSPSLTGLYVKAVKGGKFAVYTGTLSSKEQDKLKELDQSADVIALRDEVNKKLETLISSNQQVKEFYEMLESSGEEEEEGTENIDQEAGSAAGAANPAVTPDPAAGAANPAVTPDPAAGAANPPAQPQQ